MSLGDDAIAIWKAGLASVDSVRAVERRVVATERGLNIAGHEIGRASTRRIEVVGAGKAGAGMASGLEHALLRHWPAERLSGWINVPADCVRPLSRIHLHPARPAGINEPTLDAVAGTREILRRVQSLTSDDICIVLLSGGASALLCDPIEGITLDDKLAVTRLLASAGASIQELNCVRSQLSRVKAGGLARACNAGLMIVLIISDVIGDPLDVIGSGPTVISRFTPAHAIDVLRRFSLLDQVPPNVIGMLDSQFTMQSIVPLCGPTVPGGIPSANNQNSPASLDSPLTMQSIVPHCTNHIIASNSIAIAAAAEHARRLGYDVQSLGSDNAGDAAEHGRHLFAQLTHLRDSRPRQRVCLLSGGEPTVALTSPGSLRAGDAETMGRGGRNQELVLAAIAHAPDPLAWRGLTLLSGGTDGEDGPTDAAGAIADASVVSETSRRQIDATSFLERHDSWAFFSHIGGHLKTGPTHTNVMDLRVGIAEGFEG